MIVLFYCLLLFEELENGLGQKIIPENYDFTLMPCQEERVPLEVFFHIKINGIQDIDIKKKAITLNMLLKVSWTDERLRYPYETSNFTEEVGAVNLRADILDKIWKPDHFFKLTHSAKKFKMLHSSVDVKLLPSKKIITRSQYIINLKCSMNFRYYPFDTQICPITLASYFYTAEELIFSWDRPSLIVEEAVNIQMDDYKFSLIAFNETVCNANKRTPDEFPCIRLVLTLKRYYWVQIVRFFIPSSIVVAVAWFSFFWPPQIVNGRTILTTRSFLAIIDIYKAARKESPENGYPDALDTWMYFVFLAGIFPLFEYAIILQCLSYKKRIMNAKVHPAKTSYNLNVKEILRYETYQRRTEMVGRIGYPVAFFIFNLCFWIFYLWG